MSARSLAAFGAGFAAGVAVLALILWQSGSLRPVTAQNRGPEMQASRASADREAPAGPEAPPVARPAPEPPRPEPQIPIEKLPQTAQPGDDTGALLARHLLLPVAHVDVKDILDTFNQARPGGRKHEATDLMAPRGTPVVAVDDGSIVKLFNSRQGGLTIYQFDPTQTYCYYYAHLDRYEEGLHEGMTVRKGDPIGYVGSTGDASPEAPHLHFTIFKLGPEKHWWQGTPVNPYPILMGSRVAGKAQ